MLTASSGSIRGEPRGWRPWFEEAWDAECCDMHRVYGIDEWLHRGEPCRRGQWSKRGDPSPEFAQSFDPPLRGITGDQSRIDAANGDTDDPAGYHTRFDQTLVHTGLVGPECAAALQQEDLVIKFT
jgi:hypothetical protein